MRRLTRRRLAGMAGQGGAKFDWYVNSVTGNDANDGKTPNSAYATIGALTSISAGDKIGLAKGSMWREMLTIGANNVQVSAYGTGDKPILDCADVIAVGDWSKSDGLTNVYQCTKSPALDAVETYNGIFEDGIALTRVANTATCDSTPGSFAFSSNTVAPCTLYVHPTGSGDPATNSKAYTFSSRLNAITSYGYTGIRITGIHGKHCLNGSGNFRIGNSSYLNDCLSTWGVKHNYYIGEGGVMTDCVATDIREYAAGQTGTMYVYNSNNPSGGGVQFIRCTAQSTAQNLTGAGFYGHFSVGGNYGTILFRDCIVTKMANAIYGISGALNIINPTITDCVYGIKLDPACDGVTVTGGSFTTSLANSRSIEVAHTAPFSINGLTIVHTGTVSGASIYIPNGIAPDLTLTDVVITVAGSSLFVRAYGNTGGTINVTGTQFKGSSTDGSVYYTISGGPVVTSDYNNFARSDYNFQIQGTGYNDVAAYKAGSGQDANSTVG
jgi:hypothetical protein